MTDAYDLVERAPTLSEYRQICTAVGWDTLINFAAAAASLGNSLYHVVALYEHAIVGMARIVGDGAMYFYIQDVAVLPAHQGHGVGGLLMEHVVAYLRSHAPAQAFVGLFAAEGTHPLYERYGFRVYPALMGMFRVTPIEG